jgi:3-deoxy-D-manno-octulosonic acid kinase
MSDLTFYNEGPYRLGAAADIPLDDEQRRAFVELLKAGQRLKLNPLGGRNCIAVGEVPGVGSVVARQYMRGGFLRFVIEALYFRFGKTRGEREFGVLHQARSVGVNVPDPLGFAVRGGLFYEAWLFTREIPETKSIVEYAFEHEDGLPQLIDALLAQVVLLIRNRIFHVDLHPGNVLADRAGKVYLLDFDKAVHFRGTLNDLRDRYLCRWRRAVIKHQLPDVLAELMSHGLRINFE